MKGRSPDPQSLTGQARAFFAENPGAELTPLEIAQRLGLTKVQAYTVIKGLTERCGFESVRVIRKKKEQS